MIWYTSHPLVFAPAGPRTRRDAALIRIFIEAIVALDDRDLTYLNLQHSPSFIITLLFFILFQGC